MSLPMPHRMLGLLVLVATVVVGCTSSSVGDGVPSEDAPKLPVAAGPVEGVGPAVHCDEAGVCATVEPPANPRAPKPPSAKSKAMTADKRLTREEYEEAFADFQACVAASGLELYEVSTSGTYITYSTGVGDAWDDCYEVHFFEPDSFWQGYEHPRYDLGAHLEVKVDCLDDAKIEHPAWRIDVPRRDQAFLYDEISEFVMAVEVAGRLTPAQSEACWAAPSE